MAEEQHITFYLDRDCASAYKTSLWIREVRNVRPLEIDWRFLSLRAVNEGSENLKDGHFLSANPFRVMAKARRERGTEAVDALYAAIGRARFEERKDISETQVLEAAAGHAGIDPAIVTRALEDETTITDVEDDHRRAVSDGAFGVPSIDLEDRHRPFFGPVISDVPQGERAGELWDRFAWLIQQDEFYEIKRER